MDEVARRRYLEALGVPLWLSRRPLAEATTALTPQDPAPAATDPLTQPSAAEEEPRPMSDDRQEALGETADDVAPVAADARAAAIARMPWDALAETAGACTACALCATRTQAVFGVGDRRAAWLIVGEAPGADEDRQGEPFVGRAGKLLNPMLRAIGLQREQVYIANILKCRPPENRDPTPHEALQCRPFLNRQIALIQPRIVLAVGRIAAQQLLGTETPIGKLRGQVHRFGPDRIPLVVTYHPAYLLRSPREKRRAWDDLRLARRALSAEPPTA